MECSRCLPNQEAERVGLGPANLKQYEKGNGDDEAKYDNSQVEIILPEICGRGGLRNEFE